jgi:hypothetical protein
MFAPSRSTDPTTQLASIAPTSPRHRIPPNFDFVTLKPEFGGQADRLAAASRKQLRLRYAR